MLKHKQSTIQAPEEPVSQRLTVDKNNRTPVYHQLYLILRSRIFDGEYGNGTYLPSEHKLAQIYNVSRITATRTLNELAADGLVVRERGRGTRVRFVSQAMVVRGPAARQRGDGAELANSGAPVRNFRDILREHGDPRYDVLSFERVPVQPEVADILNLRDDTLIYRTVRLGYCDGRPYRHTTTYAPIDIAQNWTIKELSENTVAELLRRGGVKITRIDEGVTATLADADVGRVMDMSVGSPLIKVMRTVFDAKNRPVEYQSTLYPPERFRYNVSMVRRP
jgi:GntR family transcriptional regulator